MYLHMYLGSPCSSEGPPPPRARLSPHLPAGVKAVVFAGRALSRGRYSSSSLVRVHLILCGGGICLCRNISRGLHPRGGGAVFLRRPLIDHRIVAAPGTPARTEDYDRHVCASASSHCGLCGASFPLFFDTPQPPSPPMSSPLLGSMPWQRPAPKKRRSSVLRGGRCRRFERQAKRGGPPLGEGPLPPFPRFWLSSYDAFSPFRMRYALN